MVTACNTALGAFSTTMIDLSIIIITYNRSPYLRRTLATLAASLFCNCELWILNNASTDDTLTVCAEFTGLLPNMQVVTHRFNIGAYANTMRAYEYGTCHYKWILCDLRVRVGWR